ncbi:hypothetical protein WN55_06557 [Dufourea novaeangliae]|uniref:Uncharacterized protein n=1 Tax=Dufourea novaeangliae TaxID=178035 RepID=A0A154PQK5_DUFNO|nr:hypothetical protein WN55_06557 [Dufourea novaeangliae]
MCRGWLLDKDDTSVDRPEERKRNIGRVDVPSHTTPVALPSHPHALLYPPAGPPLRPSGGETLPCKLLPEPTGKKSVVLDAGEWLKTDTPIIPLAIVSFCMAINPRRCPVGYLPVSPGHVSPDYEVTSSTNGRAMILTRETRAYNLTLAAQVLWVTVIWGSSFPNKL